MNTMRCLIRSLVGVMFFTNGGCMTQRMLHAGQTLKHAEEDGSIIVDKKGNPAAYPFFVFTVPLDVFELTTSVAWVRIGTSVQPMMNHV